jgi:hypothetical protein
MSVYLLVRAIAFIYHAGKPLATWPSLLLGAACF